MSYQLNKISDDHYKADTCTFERPKYYRNINVPIIMGSESDLELGQKISKELEKYGVNSVIRICSAHKAAHSLTGILDIYSKMDIKC